MEYEYIIDNCLDPREFRNFINTVLIRNGFKSLGIDDPRLSDDDPENDNDILVVKDGVKYTVQTFLNAEITEKQIDETLQDMEKEKVSAGVIITNQIVSHDIVEKARRNHIEVWDKQKLLLSIHEV